MSSATNKRDGAGDFAPTMVVDTRKDLSFMYKVLRTAIKPLRPRLVRPSSPLPPGSPRLSQSGDFPSSPKGYTVNECQDDGTGLWLYDVLPRGRATGTAPPHRVLFFAGGGFQMPPSKMHWKFVSALAASFPTQYQFTIVSYPLAPNNPAHDSLETLRAYLSKLIDAVSANGGHISLMGDSAGGNIAISLGLWWAEHGRLETRLNGATAHERSMGLRSIIAISPAVDLRNVNSRIWEVERHDPILNFEIIERAASAWSGSSSFTAKKGPAKPNTKPPTTPRTDPSISPLLSSASTFQALAATETRLHGLVGTHDILSPDALLFKERCEQAGVCGEWLLWEGQMHCFVLAGVYGLPEGKEGIRFLEGVLRRNM
jgi:acetyl esterase/lipase